MVGVAVGVSVMHCISQSPHKDRSTGAYVCVCVCSHRCESVSSVMMGVSWPVC